MINLIALSSFNIKYYDLILKYNLSHEEKIEFRQIYGASFLLFPKRYNFEFKNISLNLYHKDITKEIVNKAHGNGNAVMAWFKMKEKENEEIYKNLFDYGIDFICCNEPNKAILEIINIINIIKNKKIYSKNIKSYLSRS